MKFRIASLLLWLKLFVLMAAIGTLGYATYLRDGHFVKLAIAGFLLTAILSVVQWLVALGTKCPLCITPVLAPKHCSKNKKAKTFLGSYRLRVATSVLFRNYFRCPYCSEPTTLEVRTRRSRA